MSANKKITRRRLLQTAAVFAPIAMTGCATAGRDGVHDVLPDLLPDNEPLVRTTDPVARSLAYYSDTRDVAADDPLAATHDVKQKCSNCVHSRDSVGAGRLECPMFPGRSVSKDGWCSIWAQG